MNIAMISAFVLYFTTLLGIASFFYKRKASATQFMVGNRSVNYWVTAIATQASDMGSWLFLAFPGAVYAQGLFEIWTAIGLVVFMFLTWQFVAPRLRQQTEQYGSLTLSSFLATRFHDTSGRIELASGLMSLVFFVFYIASGLVALGRLFEAAFDIPYHIGIVISIVTVTLYTLIGGFIAIAWCDFFQGIFMLAIIMLVPLVAYTKIGSLSAITATAQAHHISLALFPSGYAVVQALFLAVGWGLGYFGQPHILVNFMGIDNPGKIAAAKWVGITWQILALTAAACIGLVGIAYVDYGSINQELLFIVMAKSLFNPFFAGLVLCGIFAATLSTMDLHILISGSVIAQDFYKKLFTTEKHLPLVWVSRIGSCITALCALAIAFGNTNSVYNLVNYAWSGLGSSFGPAVLMALYSKHATRQGILAGIIVGGFVAGLWPFVNTSIFPMVPGFISSLLAIWLGSYRGKHR